MKTIYVALSLTHVKTEEEKEEIRRFLRWLEREFDIRILLWAFDVDAWSPKPVENVYEFDSERVSGADLVIVLYLSSDGSDGRGGEVVQRTMLGKPLIAFARHDVKVSRYPADCLKKAGVSIERFSSFEDMRPSIVRALATL